MIRNDEEKTYLVIGPSGVEEGIKGLGNTVMVGRESEAQGTLYLL